MKFFKGKIFWGIVIAMFSLMLLELGLRGYERWHGQKRVEELAKELQRIEDERQARMARDTIGGKTPQETLQMFIDAVEKGDYEMASKYFVAEKQRKELESLQNSQQGNINNVINLLEQTKNYQGEYSEDKKSFSVYKPILVNFTLYPSGSWKIEEI